MRKSITATIINRYERYFHSEKLRDQEKAWAPHIVCSPCCSILTRWSTGGSQTFKFKTMMNLLCDAYAKMVSDVILTLPFTFALKK